MSTASLAAAARNSPAIPPSGLPSTLGTAIQVIRERQMPAMSTAVELSPLELHKDARPAWRLRDISWRAVLARRVLMQLGLLDRACRCRRRRRRRRRRRCRRCPQPDCLTPSLPLRTAPLMARRQDYATWCLTACIIVAVAVVSGVAQPHEVPYLVWGAPWVGCRPGSARQELLGCWGGLHSRALPLLTALSHAATVLPLWLQPPAPGAPAARPCCRRAHRVPAQL